MLRQISNFITSIKIAIYIRVSTTYQVDKDSLPMQREDLSNYCRYVLNTDNFEIFEDAGYSAKNVERPAYQQMMARVRTGEFSHVLVWKIDRISRNLMDFTNMYNELKLLGCTFVSKNEQFDTSTAIGEAVMKIIVVFAELERKMTSERVTAVMISRASEGKWNGGRIPFGYDYDPETRAFTVNDTESGIINMIYDKYEESHSLIQVTKLLNGLGYRTRSGKDWSPTTVAKMLNNPFYLGMYRYNVFNEKLTGNSSTKHKKSEDEWVIVEDHHPAIVEQERFMRVQEVLMKNRRSNKEPKTYARKNVHIFAGLTFCGYCNQIMQASQDRARSDGYRPSIYACTTKRRFNTCPNKYISDVIMGPFVMNYIANIIKASNNFGRSTTMETFQKKLLRGSTFENVTGIEQQGLKEMFLMLKSGASYESVFRTPVKDADDSPEERDLLLSEKRKCERALGRLKALLLYDDSSISEKDFVLERKSIMDKIDQIDNRLAELDAHSKGGFQMSDGEFMQKASFFILQQKLQEKRYIDYDKFIRTIDPQIVKNFMQNVVQKIVVKNGKITSIMFSNGIEHKFLYSDD